jgi:fibronectin-binding autotransporter adhesin
MNRKSSLVAEVRRCEGSGVRRNVVQTMSPCDVIRPSWPLLRCLALIALAGVYPLPSPGATHVVATLTDNGPGSLRQAIADALPGDTITFATNGTIRLTSGELFLDKSLDLVGPGATNLAVSGSGLSRVFNIPASVTCSISGLTIRDGRTADGTNGVPASEPGRSGSPGGSAASGGGLYNLGTLTMYRCIIIANRTGSGGQGTDGTDGFTLTNVYGMLGTGGGWGGWGGSGGSGGGLYNGDTLTLNNCVFSANGTGNGGSGGNGGRGGNTRSYHMFGGSGGNGGRGGFGGDGAAIYNLGTARSEGCTFAGNTTGNGGGGGRGGAHGVGTVPGYNGSSGVGEAGGAGGSGGAIWHVQDVLTMMASALADNSCGAGGNGGRSGDDGIIVFNGAGGDGGSGGGIGNSGTVDVSLCSFSGNSGGVGGVGGFNGSYWGSNGAPGDGGAMVSKGTLAVSASTFSGNSCYASGGGLYNGGTGIVSGCTFSGNRSGDSSHGWGGGIANSGSLTLSNCTVSSNLCPGYYSDGGGIYTSGLLTAVACTVVSNRSGYLGGGIYNYNYEGSDSAVRNSLIAGNVTLTSYGRDLFAGFCSLGHNLIGDGSYGFTNTGPGDIAGSNAPINPLIGPLADNGGPTWTHALLPGSPALDAGDDALAGTDQRGRPRRAGARVDIGAFEYGPATPQFLTGLQRQPTGAFQFGFTNLTDVTFNVLATTNVALPAAQWDNLGPATRLADTLYQFTDPAATNNWRRFYQLRWP